MNRADHWSALFVDAPDSYIILTISKVRLVCGDLLHYVVDIRNRSGALRFSLSLQQIKLTMIRPETYTFGLLPEAQRRTGTCRFSIELYEKEAETLKFFIKGNGPEVPLEMLKSVDEDLYNMIHDALTDVAGNEETDLQWPDDIVMDYYPEYFD